MPKNRTVHNLCTAGLLQQRLQGPPVQLILHLAPVGAIGHEILEHVQVKAAVASESRSEVEHAQVEVAVAEDVVVVPTAVRVSAGSTDVPMNSCRGQNETYC